MVRGIDSLPPERLLIPGPVGNLTASLEIPAQGVDAAVLLLHPHPLQGGNRRNNVVRHGALGALGAGCAALRLDFRGAGESEGAHDEGFGEVEDAGCALEWLAGRVPGQPLFLWGFSFGSRVGLNFHLSHPGTCSGFLAVGWPTAFYPWPEDEDWPTPLAFLAGTEDEFVDLNGMDRAMGEGAEFTLVEGADHFFRGHLDEVGAFTRDHLLKWLA